MKNLYLNLFVALLTCSLGVLTGSAWTNSHSVDKRFENAMRRLQLVNGELDCRKRKIPAAKCEELQERVNSFDFSVFIKEANNSCKIDYLSEKECAVRKEAVIRDIEENMLSQDAIKARY